MQNGAESWKALNIPYSLVGDMRIRIAKEISVEYTGFYIGLISGMSVDVDNDVTESPAEFWKMAADSMAKVQEYLKNKQYLSVAFEDDPESSGALPDFDPAKTDNEYRLKEVVFTTSYGAWDFPTQPDDIIKPVIVHSNSGIHVTGYVYSQQLMTVNGKMSWVIGWSPRVVSQDHANRFADVMFGVLQNAVKNA